MALFHSPKWESHEIFPTSKMMKVARILHEMPAVPGFGDAGKTTPYKDDPTNLK